MKGKYEIHFYRNFDDGKVILNNEGDDILTEEKIEDFMIKYINPKI